MSHAFIAHSADQLDHLLTLHEALRAAGVPTKYVAGDVDDLDAANAMIDTSSLMLVLVSYESMRSKAVRSNIQRALQNGLKIIGIQADRAKLTGFMKSELREAPLYRSEALDSIVRETRAIYRNGCPVIAVMNLKGGIGKTTLSSQLAATLQARANHRVLLIDFDPQYNLTQLFYPGPQADIAIAEDKSVISLFEKSKVHDPARPSPADLWNTLTTDPFAPAPKEKIAHSLITDTNIKGRLDIIFGQFEISKYAFSTDTDGLEAVRRNFLRALDYYRSVYDLILLDTNPNATFLTRCALQAADRVVAPMFTDIYSLRGVRLLNRVIVDQTAPDQRPAISVLFNAVERREQSDFEADTRNGVFDDQVGFKLSDALMDAALPRSRHFNVKVSETDPPVKRFLIHHGRGGGLRHVRDALSSVATELEYLLPEPSNSPSGAS